MRNSAPLSAATALAPITKVVTHPGLFHADEVCAIAYLRLLGLTTPVERRVPTPAELQDPSVLVLDIGGSHDPARHNFDHHQWVRGGKDGVRWDSGIPYAAFGLVVDAFPPANQAVAERFLERVVLPVDAADNAYRPRLIVRQDDGQGSGACPLGWEGQPGVPAPEDGYRAVYSAHAVPAAPYGLSFSACVAGFNPGPTATPADRQAAFEAAVAFASQVLENAMAEAEAYVAARQVVLDAPVDIDGKVMILPEFAPWQDHLAARPDGTGLLYVVYPSERGGYCIQQVPAAPGSMEGRKPLPAAWAAKRGEELAELCGLAAHGPATFCHGGRFIGGAETLGDALKMARLAVEA